MPNYLKIQFQDKEMQYKIEGEKNNFLFSYETKLIPASTILSKLKIGYKAASKPSNTFGLPRFLMLPVHDFIHVIILIFFS